MVVGGEGGVVVGGVVEVVVVVVVVVEVCAGTVVMASERSRVPGGIVPAPRLAPPANSEPSIPAPVAKSNPAAHRPRRLHVPSPAHRMSRHRVGPALA